jgi:hypothetical protein
MTDFKEQDEKIRQFLLGQLAEERAEQLEDRIFAEPDFAEEVQIVESELMAEYQEGTLSPAARSAFEQKYLTSPAGLRAVEHESAVNEFLRREISARDRVTQKAAIAAPAPSETPLRSTEADDVAAIAKKPEPESLLARLKSLLQARPAWAYSAIVAGLLLLIVGGVLTVILLRRTGGEDSLQAQRRLVEEDLASLNLNEATASRLQAEATVDLIPAQRSGGVMPRIPLSDADRDGIIKLRLNLLHSGGQRYRAVFFDQEHRELFIISDLPVQNTPDGPQVWLFVPTKYLKRGDYQINGSLLGKDGTYVEDNAYSFRVTAPR